VAASYRDVKPLADYVDRVGAEEMNFRRFMIKEYRGNYYVEKTIIRVKDDGDVYCSNKEHAPTADEAAAIKIAVQSAGWPRSISATRAAVKAFVRQPGSSYWEFLDARGDVIMIQERSAEIKVYVPWTLWSDGEWRRMEPDGKLPFWKPAPRARKSRIMIHEGAKAASAAQEIADDKTSTHPWARDLADYEHWGMIGGALAPHRADYNELLAQKATEVIYFCDNDFPGNSALKEVSRHYGRQMKGVMLDSRWKTSWDVADEMPKRFFGKTGKYLGPSLRSMTKAATWATEVVPVSGTTKGRPTMRVTAAFREEWFHSVSPEVYIHKDWSNTILAREEFNNEVRPFSDADDTARLLKMDAASKSAVIKYSPAARPGIYGSEDGRYVNTHQPSSIKPERGSAAPWLEFLEHLLPEEADRLELMRWVATLVASPEIKIGYGVLLISEVQGVGKSTLGEKILAPLVGEKNVSYPSESDIVDGTFNYWMAHKRLAVVHEIYAGQSSKAYHKLKSLITDKYLSVNKKHQAAYTIENWMHIFACSNSPRAIKLSWDDRRWFVPVVTDNKRSTDYWVGLNRWLTDDGGLGIVRSWADAYPHRVTPGSHAPSSRYKDVIIAEGYSAGMELVDDVLDQIEGAVSGKDAAMSERLGLRNGHAAVVDLSLVDLIKIKLHDGRNAQFLEKPSTLRKMAKKRGWVVGKKRVRTKTLGRKENDRGTLLAYFGPNSDRRTFNDEGRGLDVVDVGKFSSI
jgi:hypothetical protein